MNRPGGRFPWRFAPPCAITNALVAVMFWNKTSMPSQKNTGAARLKAERARQRFICLTNIPTPYRLHCFRALHHELARRDWDFEVLFMARTERGRYWRFSADQFDFPHRVLAGKSPVMAGTVLHINPRIIRELRPFPDVLLMAGAWGLPTNLLVALRPRITRRSTLIFWAESHLESMR